MTGIIIGGMQNFRIEICDPMIGGKNVGYKFTRMEMVIWLLTMETTLIYWDCKENWGIGVKYATSVNLVTVWRTLWKI